jgi:3-oxoacyl-[acyl-carrier protein] reductase
MRLSNKTAVVTGAGRGIGKAIVQKFLQEGAKVVFCDIDEARVKATEKELSSYGQVIGLQVNVTDRSQVQQLMNTAVEQFGQLDILINNAGIARFEPFLQISDQSWQDMISTNLTGTFICSQIAAKFMIAQRSGCMVNMASTNALMGEEGLSHYNASKAGILLLSKTIAIELAEYGIRVNCVCPGVIQTELAAEGGATPAEWEAYLAKIPLGRRGKVSEVANAFAFLASDEASFITGTELVVDGGQISQQ